jgi:hypothetical protein
VTLFVQLNTRPLNSLSFDWMLELTAYKAEQVLNSLDPSVSPTVSRDLNPSPSHSLSPSLSLQVTVELNP